MTRFLYQCPFQAFSILKTFVSSLWPGLRVCTPWKVPKSAPLPWNLKNASLGQQPPRWSDSRVSLSLKRYSQAQTNPGPEALIQPYVPLKSESPCLPVVYSSGRRFSHDHPKRDLLCEFGLHCVACVTFNVCGHTKCEFACAIAHSHPVLRIAKEKQREFASRFCARCGQAFTSDCSKSWICTISGAGGIRPLHLCLLRNRDDDQDLRDGAVGQGHVPRRDVEPTRHVHCGSRVSIYTHTRILSTFVLVSTQ